jgi:TPR repeat protein
MALKVMQSCFITVFAATSLAGAMSCRRRGVSSDRPAASSPDTKTVVHQPPSSHQRYRQSPSIPSTCWDNAKISEERDACAVSESQAADRELNAVYGQVLNGADPELRQAVRSAERAWLRYRDAYLSSIAPVADGTTSQRAIDHCRPILLARLTRGRIAELKRMLHRDLASPAIEASCDGPPPECKQAYQWQQQAYRRLAKSSAAATRARLDASQNAWRRYLAAQTEAVLASHRVSEPALRMRLRDSVRVRLSVDRKAHLATFGKYQQGAEERYGQLQTEAKMLADLEAKCGAGVAASCTSLGQALEWGWYSIDHDRRRARDLYLKACRLGNGTACASLAYAFSAGRGVTMDAARAAQFLDLGCDAGDADNCQSLARKYAKGEGTPKDVGKAAALWQHACDLSHSDKRRYWGAGHPCQNLAWAVESGELIPRDLSRALVIHKDLCERKLYDSCVAAARLLRKQGGFDANLVIALYEKGCEGFRNAYACVELGDLYRDGNGIPHDRESALACYQSACMQGFVPGCRAQSALTGIPMGDPDDLISDPMYIKTVLFVVSNHEPALRLRLFGDDYGTILRLRVFDEAKRRVIQEILVPESPGFEPGVTLPLGQVDLNFDGYKDLTLRHYQGANNYGDFIWIFDPRRRRFTFCHELSDLSHLEPDPALRVVRSYYHFSAMEGSASEYRWIRGKAVLVLQESRRYIEKDGTNCLEHVTRKLVRGRLVVTERSCE